jgi:hypothetical protein
LPVVAGTRPRRRVAGCGAFTILGAAPVLFDTPTGIPQSHVTGVLVIIYVGLAQAKASADIVPFPVREEISERLMRAAS